MCRGGKIAISLPWRVTRKINSQNPSKERHIEVLQSGFVCIELRLLLFLFFFLGCKTNIVSSTISLCIGIKNIILFFSVTAAAGNETINAVDNAVNSLLLMYKEGGKFSLYGHY